jgi:signal peptidase I
MAPSQVRRAAVDFCGVVGTLVDHPPHAAAAHTRLHHAAGEAPLRASDAEQQQQLPLQQQPDAGEQQQQQQQQSSGDDGGDDGYIRFLGLKISKDDLLTITLALAISYGIRW